MGVHVFGAGAEMHVLLRKKQLLYKSCWVFIWLRVCVDKLLSLAHRLALEIFPGPARAQTTAGTVLMPALQRSLYTPHVYIYT